MIKVISRTLMVIFILSMFFYSEYRFSQGFIRESSIVQVANGVVTDKFDAAYSCGTKGRDTCYMRYLVINNTEHNVELKTYTTTNIGDSIVLTQTKVRDASGWDMFWWIIGLIFLLFIGIFSIIYIVNVLNWAMNHSDNMSLKTYLKRAGML